MSLEGQIAIEKLTAVIILSIFLGLSSCSQAPNKLVSVDASHCEGYAQEVLRIKRVYMDKGWKYEDALLFELFNLSNEPGAEPTQALREVVKDAVGFVYTAQWDSETSLETSYINYCKWRLNG